MLLLLRLPTQKTGKFSKWSVDQVKRKSCSRCFLFVRVSVVLFHSQRIDRERRSWKLRFQMKRITQNRGIERQGSFDSSLLLSKTTHKVEWDLWYWMRDKFSALPSSSFCVSLFFSGPLFSFRILSIFNEEPVKWCDRERDIKRQGLFSSEPEKTVDERIEMRKRREVL